MSPSVLADDQTSESATPSSDAAEADARPEAGGAPQPDAAGQEPAADPESAKTEEKPGQDPAKPKPEAEGDEAESPDYSSLELPEGAPQSESFGESYIAEVQDFAQRAGLSPEAAQQVIDRDVARSEAETQRWVDQVAAWEQEIRADKELGGDNLTKSVTAAKAALARFWPPEFTAELNASGMGNHPTFLRGLVKLAAAMAEPDSVAHGGPSSSDADGIEALKKRWPKSWQTMLEAGQVAEG